LVPQSLHCGESGGGCFTGVELGGQFMAAHPRGVFDSENAMRRNSTGRTHLLDCLRGAAKLPRKGGLAADDGACALDR
jgi:hypothetical protein